MLHQQPRPQTAADTTQQTPERPRTLFLPYVQGVSERIERVCRGLNDRPVFKSRGTLRQLLVRVKAPRPEVERNNVMYEVPCMNCESVYVGETGRCVRKRIMEHKGVVRRGGQYQRNHSTCTQQDHRINCDEARVLETESCYWKRRLLQTESCYWKRRLLQTESCYWKRRLLQTESCYWKRRLLQTESCYWKGRVLEAIWICKRTLTI